jgi:hypothetical protein
MCVHLRDLFYCAVHLEVSEFGILTSPERESAPADDKVSEEKCSADAPAARFPCVQDEMRF